VSILSLTSALDCGGWSTPRPGRFTTVKETRYLLYRSLGGTQNWSGRVRKISPSPGFDPRTVTSLYTAYAVSVPAESQYAVVIVVLPTVFVFTPQIPETKHWPSLGPNVYSDTSIAY
jgi:hypothetical protein